jgi:hypothetical protein
VIVLRVTHDGGKVDNFEIGEEGIDLALEAFQLYLEVAHWNVESIAYPYTLTI